MIVGGAAGAIGGPAGIAAGAAAAGAATDAVTSLIVQNPQGIVAGTEAWEWYLCPHQVD